MNHLWYVGVILIPFRIFGDKKMSLTHPPFAETVRKKHDGDPALPVWITRQYVQKWSIKKLVGWKTLHKTGHTQPTVTQLDSLLSVYHSLSKLTNSQNIWSSKPYPMTQRHPLLAGVWTNIQSAGGFAFFSTHLVREKLTTIWCLNVIPDSPRHAPGRKFRDWEMFIWNQWPIGTFLSCRNHERSNLWGASTNEQMVIEMPRNWHERIRTKLNEWITEPWANESMIQWSNESMIQRNNESMNQCMNALVSR